ncbi:Rieske (2Fe-2S) protein [Natronorubrum texcoconense]|uniref:Ferredoxin subunit of nitrite reductase or a ring-hydroxylating dioxygenase n=1 Tax=Natronorubrum texcoconense TaxID=1095776 RepID=A0A1G8U035_9EURY|nr:Rieske (2Fe-2S) protein [Natronorubrum texcoconense]SDJ47206.1 Ferredoxin subunit of nitrite reductase or a ring-hydroxylating dioxygenase [Natronorubrum texcoconense]
MHKLTTVETVHEEGSWLFTVRDRHGEREEVILVPCDDGVEAWINRCTHEAQRFDTGRGVPMRDGQLICPRHGSLFDSCSGHCDNGEAADTTLPSIDITVHTDGTVFLTDDDASFVHEGGMDDDGGPDSTSHISL